MLLSGTHDLFCLKPSCSSSNHLSAVKSVRRISISEKTFYLKRVERNLIPLLRFLFSFCFRYLYSASFFAFFLFGNVPWVQRSSKNLPTLTLLLFKLFSLLAHIQIWPCCFSIINHKWLIRFCLCRYVALLIDRL